ncbi:hypothetical protein HUJ04_012231 [Dendroctonus ponderosae]|uniref:Importin N-terminal domain-containing protein n=2 Tax=Dendroctonus ponderosae TaxID=77166 RepID=A0AAR5P219_DENPD|nr:hypothetical protein HUJ04_012231 [Dendroctonus ponderosae]
MANSDTLPVWQKLYQIVSGSNQNIIPEVVDKVLEICRENISTVLLSFKVYTKASFEEWKKVSELMSISQDDELCGFIHHMSKELDLDVNLAWSIICNFLIFDYNEKVSDLKAIVRYESNIKSIIDQLWNFYTSERMFLLKCIRLIFEKINDINFIYADQFNEFLEHIDLKELWSNLLKTLEYLITEISVDKTSQVSEDTLEKWVQRNNREQVEVILLIVLVSDLKLMDGDELTDVMKLFMRHGFGRHPLFFGAGYLSRSKDVDDIKNAEIGVVLSLIHRYWQNHGIFKMLPKEVETDLERYQVQGDNSSILFIWAVYKSTLSSGYLDYGKTVLELLLDKKVFKSLADCITMNLFQNCRVGEIVLEATNRLFIEFSKLINDYRLIYEQDGIVKLMCELYKLSYLRALDYFGKFFEIALDMFPYKLDNFLSMVEAIIISGVDHMKIMKLLHNCPTFCTEMPWTFNSDAVTSTEQTSLFTFSDKFAVPIGTLLEKCNCFGEDVIKFKYKFNFFCVVEQFIRSLTSWAVSRGNYNNQFFNNVIRSYEFLIVVIKHFTKYAETEIIIKPLIQRLDCVPTYFNRKEFRNYNFFYVYFAANCALVKYQNVAFSEAFPGVMRKQLFPPILNYKDVIEALKLLQTSDECILYGFLKEEESLKNHKLLLEYMELILYILKKDILHAEVLFSGVWYILYVAFPTHTQWDYDDPGKFEQNTILNRCLQIFVYVLQKEQNKSEKFAQKQLYQLVLNAFLNDAYIIDHFYNVFVKDKFYIPNLMHQESNWLAGKTLIILDTIQLELSVLLLIFKHRAQIPEVKCEIDKRTHVFAKSASCYFITPYNCTLAVLAGKFLNILGKDENIPMMSCLGVNYDQVQTLFLERLRDPMEDEKVKINILNIISTCIFHQTGMTAAFFNIQSAKKWYNPDIKNIEGDDVGDFMMDYLKNIKKSVAYLKSPLQVGILRIMANLWQCQKQHLVSHITATKEFWILLTDPLMQAFEQAPLVYSFLFKIIAIQLAISLKKPKGQEHFYKATERFLNDETQLQLFHQYVFKIFSNKNLSNRALKDRELLLHSWSEVLVSVQKQPQVTCFSSCKSKCLYVNLAFEVLHVELVHQKILSVWLDFMVVVIDMFGLQFDEEIDKFASQAVDYAKILKKYYEEMSLKDKRSALTIILKIVQQLKDYYNENPHLLVTLLDEIGSLVDFEYLVVEEEAWRRLKADDSTANEWLGPWALITSIANSILTMKNCNNFGVWFSNRKYLERMVECTCQLFSHKGCLSFAKVALYSLTLYVQSTLAYDFLNINMVKFYDRIEPMVNSLLIGQSKVNILALKEAWTIFNVLMNFNRAFLRKFQKTALETCYAFLTLNHNIMNHIMSIPENTVDFKALDLLSQTLMFYNEILRYWQIEWYRKNNRTYRFMMDGIRKVINGCIYLCLRPKHIGFYYLDRYMRLMAIDQTPSVINDLMISVINRLIGILGLALSCLYKLNSSLIQLFDYFEPEETIIILIDNDFSVPRFELPIPCELTYGRLLCLAHFLCKTLNQLNQKKENNILTIDETEYLHYIGLVEHQDPSDYMPDQKLSSFLRYLYEYSGLIDPWINNLNYANTQKSADILMLFIGQQACLTIKELDPSQVPYYRANLCSELQFFQEYIKKRTSELYVERNTSAVLYTGEMDYIKKYLLSHWKKDENGKNAIQEVAERNFLLIMTYWFSNICKIQ